VIGYDAYVSPYVCEGRLYAKSVGFAMKWNGDSLPPGTGSVMVRASRIVQLLAGQRVLGDYRKIALWLNIPHFFARSRRRIDRIQ